MTCFSFSPSLTGAQNQVRLKLFLAVTSSSKAAGSDTGEKVTTCFINNIIKHLT